MHFTGNKLGSGGEGVPILPALEGENLHLLTQEGRDNLSRFLMQIGFLPLNTHPSIPELEMTKQSGLSEQKTKFAPGQLHFSPESSSATLSPRQHHFQ